MKLVRSAVRQSLRLAYKAAAASYDAAAVGSVFGGLCRYYAYGDTSEKARVSVLNLHCRTNGRFTDALASMLRMARPPREPANVEGFLGKLSIVDQEMIIEKIAQDGFYVFDQTLPDEVCDKIQRFASTTPAVIEGRDRDDRVVFDPTTPISKTYRIREQDIVANDAMQRLMADPSFLTIAERYLRTLPILSMMNLWWSPTFGDKPGAEAAQEFHFDFDPPPIWLLFFIYLTDVGPDNGPHVYVRGSHIAGHPSTRLLLKRGYVRIPDEDIVAAFGRDNVVELYGKRGTILAVDTRGFHKGKMVNSGHRLMAQLTFSCPPFSAAYGRRQPLPQSLVPELVAAVDSAPRVFERYQ